MKKIETAHNFTEGKILLPLVRFALPVLAALFLQSMSAFVAQNAGANRYDRAEKALRYSILMSLVFGVVMFFIAFFHGTVLTPIFFCFLGFYNGIGRTRFVMQQIILCLAFMVYIRRTVILHSDTQ